MENIKEVWKKLAIACILGLIILFFLEISYKWSREALILLKSLAIFCVGVLLVDVVYGLLLAENKKDFLLRSFRGVVNLVPIGVSYNEIQDKVKLKPDVSRMEARPGLSKKGMAFKIASIHKR